MVHTSSAVVGTLKELVASQHALGRPDEPSHYTEQRGAVVKRVGSDSTAGMLLGSVFLFLLILQTLLLFKLRGLLSALGARA